jgi:hypothetical protein
MDEDTTQAAWDQLEQEEHHRRVNREYQQFVKEYFSGTSQRHDSEQVPAQRGLR